MGTLGGVQFHHLTFLALIQVIYSQLWTMLQLMQVGMLISLIMV